MVDWAALFEDLMGVYTWQQKPSQQYFSVLHEALEYWMTSSKITQLGDCIASFTQKSRDGVDGAWNALLTDFFELLVDCQYMNAIKAENYQTIEKLREEIKKEREISQEIEDMAKKAAETRKQLRHHINERTEYKQALTYADAFEAAKTAIQQQCEQFDHEYGEVLDRVLQSLYYYQ